MSKLSPKEEALVKALTSAIVKELRAEGLAPKEPQQSFTKSENEKKQIPDRIEFQWKCFHCGRINRWDRRVNVWCGECGEATGGAEDKD